MGVAAQGERTRLDEQAVGVVPVGDGVLAVDGDFADAEVVVVAKTNAAADSTAPGDAGEQGVPQRVTLR
ncbi:MAG: hypothetical protein WAW42_10635 [Candidatus Competibacteraceae bacterium]